MKHEAKKQVSLTPKDLQRRKLFLTATLVTCVTLAMIFGIAHVVKLGSNRMDDMRSRAGYDLKDEAKHIRAAGEDIQRHRIHEEQEEAQYIYQLAELDALISPEKWKQIEEMVRVPAGSFVMGTSYIRANLQDQPQHDVELPEYSIDKYPVTNIQYARFVSKTNHRPPLDWVQGRIPADKLLHPVVMVTWYDAKAYCEFLGKHLPTEAEWEKAGRGVDARRWPWGNKMEPERLNTYYYVGSTTEVTRYEQGASVYGVMDLSGNVSEWTVSKFEPYHDSAAPADLFKPKVIVAGTTKDRAMKVGSLHELDKGEYKVRRGGSWKSDPFATSIYHRNYSLPHYASDFFGFRCAASSVDSAAEAVVEDVPASIN